jgi:hypothetical protein
LSDFDFIVSLVVINPTVVELRISIRHNKRQQQAEENFI